MNCKVCSNTSTNTPGIPFFRFPREMKKCQRWAELCHLKNSYLKNGTSRFNKSFRICSEHFDADEMMHNGRKVQLFPSAEPKFLLKKPRKEKKESKDKEIVITKYNPSKVRLPNHFCRLCAEEKKDVISIYGWRGKNTCNLEKKLKYFPFGINKCDVLPLGVCQDCMVKVDQFVEFIEACIQAQAKLKDLLNDRIASVTLHLVDPTQAIFANALLVPNQEEQNISLSKLKTVNGLEEQILIASEVQDGGSVEEQILIANEIQDEGLVEEQILIPNEIQDEGLVEEQILIPNEIQDVGSVGEQILIANEVQDGGSLEDQILIPNEIQDVGSVEEQILIANEIQDEGSVEEQILIANEIEDGDSVGEQILIANEVQDGGSVEDQILIANEIQDGDSVEEQILIANEIEDGDSVDSVEEQIQSNSEIESTDMDEPQLENVDELQSTDLDKVQIQSVFKTHNIDESEAQNTSLDETQRINIDLTQFLKINKTQTTNPNKTENASIVVESQSPPASNLDNLDAHFGEIFPPDLYQSLVNVPMEEKNQREQNRPEPVPDLMEFRDDDVLTLYAANDNTPTVQKASTLNCAFLSIPTFDLFDGSQVPTAITITTFDNIEKLTCDFCLKNFDTSERLSSHLKTHYVESNNDNLEECTTLDFLSDFNEKISSKAENPDLGINVSNTDPDDPSVQPEGEGSERKENKTEKENLKKKKRGRGRRKMKPERECEFCEKLFPTFEECEEHEKTHKGKRRYLCLKCNGTYSTKKILRRHIAVHSGETFPCPHCKTVFKRKDSLESHRRFHRRLTCKICRFAFKRKVEFLKHQKEHKLSQDPPTEACEAEKSEKELPAPDLPDLISEGDLLVPDSIDEFLANTDPIQLTCVAVQNDFTPMDDIEQIIANRIIAMEI